MANTQEYSENLTDTGERRRHTRRATALNYVKIGNTNGGIVLNISEGGLALTAAEPLAEGFVPRIRFQLTEGGRWIEASARVVWLTDSKKGAGLQFVEIAEEDRQSIRQWIASKSTPAEMQQPVRSPRKSQNEIETPKHFAPRVERVTAETTGGSREARRSDQAHQIDEARFAELFPSENAPRTETRVPPAPPATVAPPAAETTRPETIVPQADPIVSKPSTAEANVLRSSVLGLNAPETDVPRTSVPRTSVVRTSVLGLHTAETNVPETKVPKPNVPEGIALPGMPAPPPTMPDFGYRSREDWTEWVDAAPERRSKLPMVILGVVLIAGAFGAYVVTGHGLFEGLLDSIRRLMPDKIEPAPGPSVAAPPAPAGSLNAHSTPSETDTPAAAPETPDRAATGGGAGGSQETQPGASSTSTAGDGQGATAGSSSGNSSGPSSGNAAGFSTSTPGGPSATSTKGAEPILVAAPGEGEAPFRLTVPQAAVSASSSVAISSETTYLVPAEPGPEASHQPKALQPGALIFHVEPQYPKGVAQKGFEIVKVRARVGENGEVIDAQRISGSIPVAAAAISAIREWKYSPTLFNGRPVKAEENITIAFRPH